ncbi:MAG: hypothetical protein EB127_21785, partial [Alphaproteobacteria bacterium]|nr:hypothetical protein [Alphaproteobacteria bacterium]
MALGSSSNIIVGAAQVWVFDGPMAESDLPAYANGTKYATTLDAAEGFRNVGYTNNGLEITFAPDFGEVMVCLLYTS